ncbi:hypothetical protein ADP71_08510 [Vitreoscilla sp. C1]|uniref:3'-5' exonuclease n=1 Tax=Vitreoscilla sp. (strain C1) TaxID=96942 RepID=UPI00148EB66D|nr:3'-5' exonuclease [Vitreoscilla sp. C1]AUZ04592.2 hypothetical protein ADP71_08510 [Vitreoscilla sp. C1]
MAIIIPNLNQLKGRGTAGERRVAEVLRRKLGDECLVWYDVAVGKKRRYPDFIVLHPQKGLLFLEVKDWEPKTFKSINPNDIQRLTSNGLRTDPNPLAQVRGCAFALVNQLKADPVLQQTAAHRLGQLKMPYGCGVIFSKVLRSQMENALPEDSRNLVLPDHLVLYQEDLRDDVDDEAFQNKLWDMFPYQFGQRLSEDEINRVRWHLYPELRIDLQLSQTNLFDDEPSLEVLQDASAMSLPDKIKVMDLQQEQLARNLGAGHRVIHGVAGSGKTLILAYHCQYLAQMLSKPILVLCYNVVLAVKLKTMLQNKGLGDKVQVHHFNGWCIEQLKKHHIATIEGSEPIYKRQVATMLAAVEDGRISREQYGAVMIDEGHDFEPEWLQAVAKMVDIDDGNLLLLYDDAQSIYRRGGLNFTLSSVGIKAQGRTSILKMNYRNTREILHFAYEFASEYLTGADSKDDDHIPLVLPESGGVSGPKPVFYRLPSFSEEITQAKQQIVSWQAEGVALHKMAILVVTLEQAKPLQDAFKQVNVATQILVDSKAKKAYLPDDNSVAIMTLQSSKGLEFTHVVVVGVGSLAPEAKRTASDAKVLYVGMTRAQQVLVVTGSVSEAEEAKGRGVFVKKLLKQATDLAS